MSTWSKVNQSTNTSASETQLTLIPHFPHALMEGALCQETGWRRTLRGQPGRIPVLRSRAVAQDSCPKAPAANARPLPSGTRTRGKEERLMGREQINAGPRSRGCGHMAGS